MGEGGGKGKVKEGGPGKGKDKGYKKMRKRNVFFKKGYLWYLKGKRAKSKKWGRGSN